LQAYQSALHNVSLYEELAARRSTVIELNQSKSDLIAMLAHDFKGPLASIIGFTQLLQQEFAPSDESHDMLAQIERGAYRLVDLANDTLAFSRAEQNELAIDVTDNDYVELLREVAALHQDQRLIQVIASAGPVVGRFDWQRMRQVFDNLISNAIKYSPSGEPVHVAVSRVGSAAVIAVRDHGIGIPTNELQTIFERFGRASNARAARIKGTGFGLYLARSIVEQHGGRIGVESRVGYGSAFTVTVPLQLPLELAASQRALVVDPDGDVRSFVAYTLRSNGYSVRVAETVASAQEFLHAGAFGLCVIDSEASQDVAELQKLVEELRKNGAAVVTLHANQPGETPAGDVVVEKPYLTGELFAAITTATQRLKEHAAK
jgi:two-component sensor histidine kinase/CheY-like chemotaxis protein